MIDTLGIISPYIDEVTARRIECESITRTGIQNTDGKILYEFTTNDLWGSYDNRIQFKVKRKKWQPMKRYDLKSGKTKVSLIEVVTPPYLDVEFSVHKLILGHNIYGGTWEYRLVASKLIDAIKGYYENVNIPSWEEWRVRRIDVAENFLMGKNNCFEYLDYLRNCIYQRRKTLDFETTLYWPGRSTTLKFYHKGSEFKKHDRKKLLKSYDEDIVNELLEMANDIMRFEVEIHAMKLRYDLGDLPLLKQDITMYLMRLYDDEVSKIWKVKKDRKMYVRSNEVQKVLYENLSEKNAKAVIGTYLMLQTLGIKKTKEVMSKATYYRHVKMMKELNINYRISDIEVRGVNEVIRFIPYRESKYCLSKSTPVRNMEIKLKRVV